MNTTPLTPARVAAARSHIRTCTAVGAGPVGAGPSAAAAARFPPEVRKLSGSEEAFCDSTTFAALVVSADVVPARLAPDGAPETATSAEAAAGQDESGRGPVSMGRVGASGFNGNGCAGIRWSATPRGFVPAAAAAQWPGPFTLTAAAEAAVSIARDRPIRDVENLRVLINPVPPLPEFVTHPL
ncbi:hypothetical protein GCM10009839_56570 [Catenulispora yoronensis]|uniref:Uncharacterized protein n=1 Tax=Catenulispora yoronensis TaxID=450799 RepID=A0ABP5GIM7_9ACTN